MTDQQKAYDAIRYAKALIAECIEKPKPVEDEKCEHEFVEYRYSWMCKHCKTVR